MDFSWRFSSVVWYHHKTISMRLHEWIHRIIDLLGFGLLGLIDFLAWWRLQKNRVTSFPSKNIGELHSTLELQIIESHTSIKRNISQFLVVFFSSTLLFFRSRTQPIWLGGWSALIYLYTKCKFHSSALKIYNIWTVLSHETDKN